MRPDAQVPDRIDVPPSLWAPLVASLRTFHAGETGEGRVVVQARQLMGDRAPAFVDALGLYIAEEGRHARELSLLLRALGAEAAPAPRTAHAFRAARRAIGFRTKMAILTAAEVVGIVYYDLLAERAADPALRRVVRTIGAEERAHVVFQREFFTHEVASSAGATGTRAALTALEAVMAAAVAAAIAVFAVDQRELLGALGVSRAGLFDRAAEVSREAMTTDPMVVMANVAMEHDADACELRGRHHGSSLAPFAAFVQEESQPFGRGSSLLAASTNP